VVVAVWRRNTLRGHGVDIVGAEYVAWLSRLLGDLFGPFKMEGVDVYIYKVCCRATCVSQGLNR